MPNPDQSLTVEAAEHPSTIPSGVTHDPATGSYSHLSPLCFHGLTNCFSHKPFALINICVAPRVSPQEFPPFTYSHPQTSQVLYVHIVAHSLSLQKKFSALESATSTLFSQNTRGGVGLHNAFLALPNSPSPKDERQEQGINQGGSHARKGNIQARRESIQIRGGSLMKCDANTRRVTAT